MGFSRFYYGRAYQLVIDRSKNIKETLYRKRHEECLGYMKFKTENQIIHEAFTIAQKFKENKRTKTYNQWSNLDIDKPHNYICYADFYFGRCVQFILDTNNKIYIEELFSIEYHKVISKAYEMKTSISLPKDGDELSFDDDYCDDDCGTWTVGAGRCRCGNRRCDLAYSGITTLDDTDAGAYAEPY